MRVRTANTAGSGAFFWRLAVLFIGLNLVGFQAQARESNLESADPYEILGVESNAMKAEITTAWRKLVQSYHPDSGVADNAKIRIINNAYQLLKDDSRRLAYDTGEIDFNGRVREQGFQVSDRERDERERTSWNQFYQASEPKVRKILTDIDPALNSDNLLVLYGILSLPVVGADGVAHPQPRLLTRGHKKAYGQMLERLGLMDMSKVDKRMICDHDPLDAVDSIYHSGLVDAVEVKEASSLLKAFEIFYVDQPHARGDFLNMAEGLAKIEFGKVFGADEQLLKDLTPILQHYVQQLKSCKTDECARDLQRAKAILKRTQSWFSCLKALLK